MENPKCPYCGGEMKFSYGYDGYTNGHYWYRCDNCNALAPEADSPEEAYAAAMKQERPKAKNIGTDYAEQDQFICSECGIHLQDWVRIDEDDYEDGVVHEYVFRFCPNCGRRIDDER
jgi:DNA-directed RNA polymerase subunit RPC12/RpoP